MQGWCGLDKVQISKDGAEFKDYNGLLIVEDGVYTVIATDKAGNNSEIEFVIDTVFEDGLDMILGDYVEGEGSDITLVFSEPIKPISGWIKVDDCTYKKHVDNQSEVEQIGADILAGLLVFEDLAGNKSSNI